MTVNPPVAIRYYQKLGFGAPFLAFLLNLFPKVVFFTFFSFKPATPQMESLFQQNFQSVTERYTAAVRQLKSGTTVVSSKDLNTGKATAQDEYPPVLFEFDSGSRVCKAKKEGGGRRPRKSWPNWRAPRTGNSKRRGSPPVGYRSGMEAPWQAAHLYLWPVRKSLLSIRLYDSSLTTAENVAGDPAAL